MCTSPADWLRRHAADAALVPLRLGGKATEREKRRSVAAADVDTTVTGEISQTYAGVVGSFPSLDPLISKQRQ